MTIQTTTHDDIDGRRFGREALFSSLLAILTLTRVGMVLFATPEMDLATIVAAITAFMLFGVIFAGMIGGPVMRRNLRPLVVLLLIGGAFAHFVWIYAEVTGTQIF